MEITVTVHDSTLRHYILIFIVIIRLLTLPESIRYVGVILLMERTMISKAVNVFAHILSTHSSFHCLTTHYLHVRPLLKKYAALILSLSQLRFCSLHKTKLSHIKFICIIITNKIGLYKVRLVTNTNSWCRELFLNFIILLV